ncbi:MAG TPA: glycoside hydrolase family 27 protein, partial [Bryobacteraceae bacterium]|nr:glycoside hydrolase family 27 protein [Bryobacteraceae bacterium]
MKYILVGICGAFLSQWAWAADLTGRWVAEAPGRQTVFSLKSDGDVLTGYLSSPQGDDPIAEGKITGDTVSFVVIGDFYGQERRTQYTGRITAEGLMISAQGGRGGRGPREMLAKRVSTDAPKPFTPVIKLALPPPATAVRSNGLAKTPPMGWNSWNKFQRRVDDKVVREVAAAMAKNAMKDAGYVYINIDDTWQGTRDAKG